MQPDLRNFAISNFHEYFSRLISQQIRARSCQFRVSGFASQNLFNKTLDRIVNFRSNLYKIGKIIQVCFVHAHSDSFSHSDSLIATLFWKKLIFNRQYRKNKNKKLKQTLNINSMSSKLDKLKYFPQDKVDILFLTESKLYSPFLSSQFLILGPCDLIETETEVVYFYKSGRIYHARN